MQHRRVFIRYAASKSRECPREVVHYRQSIVSSTTFTVKPVMLLLRTLVRTIMLRRAKQHHLCHIPTTTIRCGRGDRFAFVGESLVSPHTEAEDAPKNLENEFREIDSGFCRQWRTPSTSRI